MSETDFTILMWLKNSKKSNMVPKEILVANAMAAVEEVTDVFMDGVLDKINKYKDQGLFDEESAGLILENIFCRRELVQLCSGDFNSITYETLKTVQEKYENDVITKAKINNKELSNALQCESNARRKAEQEKENIKNKIKDNAKSKASKKSRGWKYVILVLSILIIIGLSAFGIASTIIHGLAGEFSLWGLIAIIFAVLGIVDFAFSKLRLIIKISKIFEKKIYDYVYKKNLIV